MVSKAGVVVFDNVYKKVLTISNQFDANIGLPKGSIENGEDSYNAAFRELYEETGIKFDNKPEIVSEFINRNCDCKFYVIYLPKASCKEISWKVETENIFHIKWRTLEELIILICLLYSTNGTFAPVGLQVLLLPSHVSKCLDTPPMPLSTIRHRHRHIQERLFCH